MNATAGASVQHRPNTFEERKAVIVRAAAEIMNRKGVHGMMLADVAARLAIVPSAVNYYFRRKEDLAAACFLQALAHYNSLLDRADLETSAPTSLRRFLHEFADHLADEDTGKAAAVVTFDDVRTLRDPAVDAAFVELFRRVRRIFGPQLPGPASRSRRNAQTHLLISQVFWAVLWLRSYDPGDYRRMMDRLYDILVNGLAANFSTWNPVEQSQQDDTSDPSGERRAAFLRAATEMINSHGYLGASVSRISARLNVTKGSFYHYHQGKDEIVEQCLDRTLTIMMRSQAAADATTADGFNHLASFAASMVRRGVSGEVPLLRISALAAVPQELRTDLVSRFGRVTQRVASVVSDGIIDGSVRPVDANVGAQTIAALVNAGTELRDWSPGIDAETAVEVYARPLFMGLFGTSFGALKAC